MHLGLQANAAHPDRLFHVLPVDDEFLRLHQQQTLVGGDVDGFGRLHHPRHIGSADLAVLDGHHAAGVHAANMATGDAGIDARDLAVGHQLGFFQRLLNALHGGVNVHHHATLEAVAGRHAKPGELELAVGHDFGHHHHDFGGAYVQAYDQIFIFFCHLFTSGSMTTVFCSSLLLFLHFQHRRGHAAQA